MLRALPPHLQRLQRIRRAFESFTALVATPGDLDDAGDGVVLPGTGTLYVSCSVQLNATTLLVDANTRQLGAPAGVAGAEHCLGFFERGMVLKKRPGAPGTVRVFVRGPAGTRHLIGEA